MKTNYSGAVLVWLVTALILTACGGGGATNSNQTTNTAPVANAGTAQNVTAGTLVTLNGSASSDANNDPLTYAWTLTSKPTGSTAALASATSSAPTFTADVAGTYVASLIVNDGQVNSASASVTITATVANAAPVANAGAAQNVTTGTLVTLNGSASTDANGDPLTYSWTLTSKPASSTTVLTGATLAAPTFTADAAGTYVASLVVNDGQVNSVSASVTITATVANAAPAAKWTYMVYIAGDNTLSNAVDPDILEMMAVGSSTAINVVVQAENNPSAQQGTWRGRIVKNMTSADWLPVSATGGGVDMTNPQTLTDFILWAKNTYPAENYALVLWSHGGGWKTQKLARGALQDVTSAGANAPMMSLNNIVKAVNDSGVHFGLINFDACLMGMYEVAYAFRNVADYLVASEEVEPGDGDDYAAILTALTTTPTMTASTLSATIVSTYRSYYADQGRNSITKSVVDLSKIAALRTAVDNLATVMTNGMGILRTSIQSAQVATANYEYTDNRDLSDFAAQLKISSADAALVSATTAVQTAVSNAVVSNQIYTPDSTKPINRSKGIAIYLPTKDETNTGTLADYGLLDTSLNGAGAQSAWAGFVNLLVTGDTVNNYVQKAPGNFGYVLTWDNPAVDLDLYMYEPVNLAAPWMGTTTINGFMSADSSETGVQAEYYVAAPTVEAGWYDVFVNYFSGVGTTTATLYYDNGSGSLVAVAQFVLKDTTKADAPLWAFPDTDYNAMLSNTYGDWRYDHSHQAVYDPTIIRMLTPQKQHRLLSGKALSQRAHFRAQQKAGKPPKSAVVR